MGSRDVELDLIGHDHTGHATRSAAGNLDQLERKMGRFNSNAIADLKRTNAAMERQVGGLRQKLDRHRQGFARSGVSAARAFSQSFIRTISLGLLGRRGFGVPTSTAAKVFGPLGVAAGVAVAAKLLAVLGDVITAGLPLVLGPLIAALPFVHLWKGATDNLKNRPKLLSAIEKAQARLGAAEKRFNDASTKAGKKSAARAVEAAKANLAQKKAALAALGDVQATEKAVSRLKSKWKSFTDFVSKPFKPAFVAVLKEVGKGLDRLKKPFASLVKAIGPVLKPFTKGVFDGIVAFAKALGPAMPGITAGLKEWGKQFPKIGKSLGDMFTKILGDPGRVAKAVDNVVTIITGLLDLMANLVVGMTRLGDGIETATRAITTAFYVMAIGALKAITWFLDGQALLDPAFAGIAAAAHLMLHGVQKDLQGIKSEWAAAQQAIAKRVIVAKIQATITDLEKKIAAAKAKLKTVHGKKARAKIEATIKDLEAKAAAAKRRLAQVQGTRTQAKIKAEIHDLQAKVTAAKARLKTVHNAKTQAKIRADISDLQAKAAAARRELASIHGKTVSITATYTKINRTINKAAVNSGNNKVGIPSANPTKRAAGDFWAGAAGGSYRTGGPRVVLGDTNVDSRVFIDGRELRAMARSTVIDETRRNAHRARVGRR